jgi:hypothetical protein
VKYAGLKILPKSVEHIGHSNGPASERRIAPALLVEARITPLTFAIDRCNPAILRG